MIGRMMGVTARMAVICSRKQPRINSIKLISRRMTTFELIVDSSTSARVLASWVPAGPALRRCACFEVFPWKNAKPRAIL